MDLYNPLYIDRPTVEPELFASLRPVTYSGGFKGDERAAGRQVPTSGLAQAGPAAGAGFGRGGAVPPGAVPLADGSPGERENKAKDAADRKRFANDVGRELADKLNIGTVQSAATAGALGDFFQYIIDHPVTLFRQKSAMLPIIGKDIEGTRLSIYNENVQKKHPLLGLRFKNTSGAHLNQGPITVFEGSVYAGDTRVLDVQPNEERLVSYAIDLGTEVDPKAGAGQQRIISVKAVRGIITTVTKVTDEKTYRIVNRSQTDRTLWIEHPNRTSQQFKLVDTPKPVEDTPEVYRFETAVKAGQTTSLTVKEERDVTSTVTLTNGAEDQIRYFINLREASAGLKAKLQEALTIKGRWDEVRRELQQVVADLQRLHQDQDRIRKNLRDTPRDAEVYEVYLKKLSSQEKEIDGLTERQKKLMDEEFKARKKYEDFLSNISD
jgi:hypothetical protein